MKKRHRRKIFIRRILSMCIIILSLVVLIGCINKARGSKKYSKKLKSSSEGKEASSFDELNLDNLTKLDYEKARDRDLENSIKNYMNLENLGDIKYYYNNIDLNGDGGLEKIVYLQGNYISGKNGSITLVMDEDYNVFSKISSTKAPIIVLDKKSNGYRDMLVEISGLGVDAYVARLKYKDDGYPSNASMEEGFCIEDLSGTQILIGDKG